MGEITSVAKNTKDFASLRTTIPMSMVRQWQLKPKDKLYWEWKVVDGEMVAVVNKLELGRTSDITVLKRGKTRDGRPGKK